MLRIAICDDEPAVCEILAEIINSYVKDRKVAILTEIFYTGNALLKKMASCPFDAVYLDIEMQNMNGIEVGKSIRETLDNQEIQLIYISSRESYIRQLFEVRPMNFLLKPIEFKTVYDNLELLRRLRDSYKKWFEYEKNHGINREKIEDILYFEANGRKVKMITVHGETIFYGSLKEIEKQLKDQPFLYIHNSFFIHYDAVKILQYKQVTLTNGLELPISQKFRVEVAKYQGLGGRNKNGTAY